ncbi:MAG: dihydroneopterin aldolase [Gammaproteobacteria bacterium]|nr:dihydroneopterin aldolase [Gammaproteobacteria bacterium]
MQFYAYHGVDPGERELGQRFEVDVELALDLRRAGAGDDLTATVNYRAVYDLAAATMDPPCLLLDAVAERIAAGVLAGFPVDQVTVRIRKPSVPIGGVLRHAEIELTRP